MRLVTGTREALGECLRLSKRKNRVGFPKPQASACAELLAFSPRTPLGGRGLLLSPFVLLAGQRPLCRHLGSTRPLS